MKILSITLLTQYQNQKNTFLAYEKETLSTSLKRFLKPSLMILTESYLGLPIVSIPYILKK